MTKSQAKNADFSYEKDHNYVFNNAKSSTAIPSTNFTINHTMIYTLFLFQIQSIWSIQKLLYSSFLFLLLAWNQACTSLFILNNILHRYMEPDKCQFQFNDNTEDSYIKKYCIQELCHQLASCNLDRQNSSVSP